MSKKSIIIDGLKLEQKLSSLGFSKSFVALDLGYGSSTIGNWIRRGRISPAAMKSLERAYGIKEEDILPDPEPEPEPEPVEEEIVRAELVPAGPSIDEERLYTIIFDATYKAMKQALSESVDELSVIVKDKYYGSAGSRSGPHRGKHYGHASIYHRENRQFDVKEGFF